jgi:hypothetical protein
MTQKTVKLTLDVAKKLCGDFNIRDGKCHSLQDNREMCDLPRHFVCELVLYKRRMLRREELGQDTLSAERLRTIEDCARRYAFRYVTPIDTPAGEPSWARMSDAFLMARAHLDIGDNVDFAFLRQDLLPIERATVKAALRLYADALTGGLAPGVAFPYKKREVMCEREVLFELGSEWFLGFADAVSLNRSAIFEWMFAAGDFPMIKIVRQAAIYFQGIPEAQSFTLCVFRKPGHRPKKLESAEQFEDRLYSLMSAESDSWFSFTRIERKDLDVLAVLHEMVRSGARVGAFENLGYPASYAHCEDCDYERLCAANIGADTAKIVALSTKKREG